MYLRFIGNVMTNTHSHGINIVSGATSTGGTQKVLIDNNCIGMSAATTGTAVGHCGTTAGPADSGSKLGEGIQVTQQSNLGTVTITNNFIRALENGAGEFGNRCIDVQTLGPAPPQGSNPIPFDLKIVANNVDSSFTGTFPQAAIYLGVDDQAGTPTTMHAEIHGNTVPAVAGCEGNSCGSSTGMIFYDEVKTASSGTLYNFSGSGANVSSEIANTNTGTAGKTCAVDLAHLTLTNTAPGFVPLLFAPGGVEAKKNSLGERVTSNVGSPRVAAENRPAVKATRTSATIPNESKTGAITRSQLDAMVEAALDRWATTGLTSEQLAILRRMKFEVADLPGLHLGEANGDHIRVDNKAGGNGWFVGNDDTQFGMNLSGGRSYTDSTRAPAGRIDLLTAIMHEMGHALGLEDTYAEQDRDNLMYGFLTKGERRLPAKNQAFGIVPNEKSGMHFLTGAVNIGTLPPNKSVKIVYSVTVGPIVGNPQSVSSQGTVSGSNFSNVLTSDAVAGSGPTITLLGIPPSFTSATSTTFTAGTFGTFNVTANGAPTPTITFTGTLPGGVMFGTGTLAGTATAFGTFPLVFTASNSVGSNAMQNFSLVVNPSAQDVKSKSTISGNPTTGFQVGFVGNPGTQYTIQFAPSIPALPAVPNWQTLTLQTANASGMFSAPDSPPAGTTQRFYRAIIP